MRTQFHLDGMHTEASAGTIQQALDSTAGVRKTDVSFHGKTVTIDFDDEIVQSQTLLKKMQDLGYAVTVEGEPVGGHA